MNAQAAGAFAQIIEAYRLLPGNADFGKGGHWILGGEDGKTPIEVDFEVWAPWLETAEHKRIVARTLFGRPGGSYLLVSTIFLGLDLRCRMTGPPLFFETMTFRGRESLDSERWSTWDEAQAGHLKYVRVARSMWTRGRRIRRAARREKRNKR